MAITREDISKWLSKPRIQKKDDLVEALFQSLNGTNRAGVLTTGQLAIDHVDFLASHTGSVEGDYYLKLGEATATLYKLTEEEWVEQCVFGDITYSI